MNAPNTRLGLRWLPALLLGLGTGLYLMGPGEAQGQTEEDSYRSGDKEVKLTVALDRIGVLTKGGAAKLKGLMEFTGKAGLKFVKSYSGGVHIFQVGKAKDRKALIELAREVKKSDPKTVVQAGLLVTPKGAEVPMILTDEVIVQFRPETSKEQVGRMIKDRGVEVVRQNPFVKGQYLVRVEAGSKLDALKVARGFDGVVFAHPNFVKVHVERQPVPNDPLFKDQWHHQNTGQGGGTVDADIDTPEAWELTKGSDKVVIAVIDSGFDTTHPDLVPNLWTNPGEVAGNGVDDDGNGFVDDINGWDFADNDNTLAGGTHGTAVAGCVGARGGNKLGVSGSCPVCRLILIRYGSTDFDDGLAFGYAQAMGAQIITNSWGYPIGTPASANVVAATNTAATSGRGGLGCVIFFAMNNPNVNDCTGPTPDISSLDNVIAVSRATAQDRFDLSGFGNCMDLLAPSRSQTSTGLPGITTTSPGGGYTANFGGTSAATPITAGVAGLILDVSPKLTRLQVQQLLQDTTDKIEDSAGSYATVNGFSTPAGGTATHGRGRVNAFEAVRIAAPIQKKGPSGKGGVDIFLRDNRLDWGNTEQPSNTLFEATRGFIPHWESVDIKVDAGPAFQPAATNSAAFEALADENPVSGEVNRVYVRVRNRGHVAAKGVTVKLHWAFAGLGLPALPADFWASFPADSTDTTQWHPLGTRSIKSLPYCGSSVAGTAGDAAQVVAFDFKAPAINPANPDPNHHCLLAIIDSAQDRVAPTSTSQFVVDDITPRDNNVTHRNVRVEDSGRGGSFEERFFLRNPTARPIRVRVRTDAPKGWKVDLGKLSADKEIPLKAKQELMVTMKVTLPSAKVSGVVTVIQERLDGKDKRQVMGGMTYRFGPAKK